MFDRTCLTIRIMREGWHFQISSMTEERPSQAPNQECFRTGEVY